MAEQKHPTQMLDELEDGPWPSFVSGIKRLRDQHQDKRINGVANDLLGQLDITGGNIKSPPRAPQSGTPLSISVSNPA